MNIKPITILLVMSILSSRCYAYDSATTNPQRVTTNIAGVEENASSTLLPVTATAVSPPTSTTIPTATLPSTQVATSTKPANATVCVPPPDLLETEVDIVADPFCIVWIDEFTDETGFQIILEYPQSREQFVYETEANVTQFLVPEADAPRLAESQEQCLKRKDWQVKVAALRPSGLYPFAGTAVTIECNPALLPTATITTP